MREREEGRGGVRTRENENKNELVFCKLILPKTLPWIADYSVR